MRVGRPNFAGVTTNKCPRKGFLVNKFSGIQNIVWIDNPFDLVVHIAHDLARRFRPPAFFGETDPVFARNHAAPSEHLREKFVERVFYSLTNSGIAIILVRHNVYVNVAVAGVTETRDRKTVLRAELLGEFDKIDNATARDDDVLI